MHLRRSIVGRRPDTANVVQYSDSFIASIEEKCRQCTYDAALWHVRATIVRSGKAVSIICSECVSVALVVQHTMHMSHTVISGLPSCTVVFHILYIKMKWFFAPFCLFLCSLYKSTFLNRSQPNFAHVSPFVWRRS